MTRQILYHNTEYRATIIMTSQQQQQQQQNDTPQNIGLSSNEEKLPPIIPWAWLKAVNDILTSPPFDEPDELPVELQSWLFLSDYENATNQIQNLNDMGITHVLSTNYMDKSEEVRIQNDLQKVGIVHLAVSGFDEPGYDMLGEHWEECRPFLEQARNHSQESGAGGKIVVHCQAGMNRSGLIAAAAMLTLSKKAEEDVVVDKGGDAEAAGNTPHHSRSNDPTLLDVVRDLKSKRGLVLTNVSFQLQLCLLAAKEGQLGDMPEGYNNDPIVDDILIGSYWQ